MAATAHMTLEELRRGLSWRKQLDKVFIAAGAESGHVAHLVRVRNLYMAS